MAKITIRASKEGSIGTKYCEIRTYNVMDSSRDEMCDQARRMAYAEKLEHVLVTHIDGKPTFNSMQ